MVSCEAVETSQVCPICGHKLMAEYVPGGVILECYYCISEATAPPEKLYENHCWNCKNPISSKFCMRAKNPNDGYVCVICGADLSGLRERRQTAHAG